MYNMFGKRLGDIIFSTIVSLLCLPLFLLVMVLVKMDSPGPVFFRQKRMGKDGKEFLLYKFRTMYCVRQEAKLTFEPGVRHRVTSIGGLLRKTKIDELPQLINVLKGEMSLVGPRPEVFKYKDFYSGKYEKVLGVSPGITDKASIKYRNEETLLSQDDNPEKLYGEVILPDKLEISLGYIESGISFIKDVTIIAETLKDVLLK
ncbi:MAG: sugar transferase [Candidatus Omnitrophica bacterium]|nr:sugar transferase [Candidatus Omnitrophota bacterium]